MKKNCNIKPIPNNSRKITPQQLLVDNTKFVEKTIYTKLMPAVQRFIANRGYKIDLDTLSDGAPISLSVYRARPTSPEVARYTRYNFKLARRNGYVYIGYVYGHQAEAYSVLHDQFCRNRKDYLLALNRAALAKRTPSFYNEVKEEDIVSDYITYDDVVNRYAYELSLSLKTNTGYVSFILFILERLKAFKTANPRFTQFPESENS